MKPLAPKEKRLPDLVGQGLSTVKIAFMVGTSEHTVESHRRTLLTEFDVKNSAEMMMKAIQSEWPDNNITRS